MYRPRRYFRRYSDPEAILDVPEVAEHAARIEHARRPYIETGWPLFAALPLLADAAPEAAADRPPDPAPGAERARATSPADATRGSRGSDAVHAATPPSGPRTPASSSPSTASSWDALTPYEKCLFWWTEIQLYGFELPGRIARIPFLRVSAERLHGRRSPGARAAARASSTSRGMTAGSSTRRRVTDRWHAFTGDDVDPLEVHRHPTTVDVAERLGYDVSGLNLGALERQYVAGPEPAMGASRGPGER